MSKSQTFRDKFPRAAAREEQAMRKRRSFIVNTLTDLSRNGWEKARPEDYQPLEAELRLIDARISARGNAR